MTLGARVFLSGLLSALIPVLGLAQAEDEPLEQEPEAAGEETTAGRPLRFSAAINAEYNDNRDSSEEKIATFDTYLRPGIVLFLDSERALLDARYTPAYRYRSAPVEGQSPLQLFDDLFLDARFRPTSRLVLGISDRLNESDDPTVQKLQTSLRRDAIFYLNRASAQAKIQLTPKTRLELEGRHALKRYAEERYRVTGDEQNLVGTGTLWYRFARTFSVAGMGAYERFDYPGQEGVDRDFNSLLTALGLLKQFSGMLTATATMGWKTMDFADPEMGTDSGPYGRASLSGTPARSLRTEIGLSHMLRDADVYPYASQRYSGADATVEWSVLEELTLGVLGAYRVGVYDSKSLPRAFIDSQAADAASEAALPEEGGTETATIAEGWISYRFGTGKSLRVHQRFEILDSDLSDSFNRNLTGLAFIMEF